MLFCIRSDNPWQRRFFRMSATISLQQERSRQIGFAGLAAALQTGRRHAFQAARGVRRRSLVLGPEPQQISVGLEGQIGLLRVLVGVGQLAPNQV